MYQQVLEHLIHKTRYQTDDVADDGGGGRGREE